MDISDWIVPRTLNDDEDQMSDNVERGRERTEMKYVEAIDSDDYDILGDRRHSSASPAHHRRIPLEYSRAVIEMEGDGGGGSGPFGLDVPRRVPGVPARYLAPRGMWDDPAAYDRAAAGLAAKFHRNFQRFEDYPDQALVAAVRAGGAQEE